MGQMMGMMPGMMGGGIGGIAGMLLPMITSAIQSELVSTPSMPALNAQTLNQAAVTSQATEQTIQEAQGSFFNPQVNVEPNRMTATNQSGFAYNMPGDIEWPDWASMLGGNHYEEMKNYKKNMSWG
jgi:predicted lipid-binding transport protein (Tim44 family)